MTHEKKIDITLDASQPLKNKRYEKFANLYVTSPLEVGLIYRDAGYKCSSYDNDRNNAYKLLRLDCIRLRIKHLTEERNARLGLDGDNVIRGLYMVRDRCAGGKLVVDRQGNPVTIMVDIGDGQTEMRVQWRMDTSGFNRASELLAKYHGLLTEKVDITDNRVREEKIENMADDIISNLQQSKAMRSSIGSINKKKSIVITDYPVDEAGKVDTPDPEVIMVNPKDRPIEA